MSMLHVIRRGRHGMSVLPKHRQYQIRAFARREPPMPPLTNPVMNAIETAQQRGELDNLSGAGKPLPKRTDTAVPTGMSGSELLSQKAEYEMRRAIHNKELDEIAGHGEKLQYKGTSVGVSIGSTGEGGGSDVMSTYVAKEAKLSADELKKVEN